MDKMKIAFIGDSFCADANRNFDAYDKKRRPNWLSWVELVAQNYNAEIICTGEVGRALFHAYETLLEVIDEADYIVLCITKEFRLPNKYRIGITPSTTSLLRHPDNNEYSPATGKKLKKAATSYYAELMSIDFHSTVHYLLIKEIDNLLHERNKKCIWFFVGYFQLFAGHEWQQQAVVQINNKKDTEVLDSGIDYFIRNGKADTQRKCHWCLENENGVALTAASILDQQRYTSPTGGYEEGPDSKYLAGKSYKIKSGPVCDTTLSGISEFDFESSADKGMLNKLKEEKVRLNHLSKQNNIHMAKLITDTIDSDDLTPRKIKASDYFKGLKPIPQWVTV
jgi:hypothetical protein